MLEITAKLKSRRGAYAVEVKDRLALPFDKRQKSRLLAQLESGEAVALKLPRGEVLRGGDLVVGTDGRVIEVVAEPEALLQRAVLRHCRGARIVGVLGARRRRHRGVVKVHVRVGCPGRNAESRRAHFFFVFLFFFAGRRSGAGFSITSSCTNTPP